MAERYFAKVVSTPDKYSVVINKGADQDIHVGQKFLIVGLGDIIIDPDTGEELEKLEIVRGQVSAEHVQQKIATLKSCEYVRSSDVKQIKKVTARGGYAMLGPQDTVTESITPGEQHLKIISGAKIGDFVIKL